MLLTRMLFLLGLLAVVILGAMYATDSWIFAFAPNQVDELTLVYLDTRERVQLSPEQAEAVLTELRAAPDFSTLDDIASLPEKYVASHELLTREGERERRYLVFQEHGLVADSNYQDLRQLGSLTAELIASLKPTLPGLLDLVAPTHLSSASGEAVPYTRYWLPVAYGAADFRLYTTGSWNVPWDRQALVLAAWGEQIGSGYHLQIIELTKVDRWLCVTVDYSYPELNPDDTLRSYPLDAALIDRNVLENLYGVCYRDRQGTVFATQALGRYPVERHFAAWGDRQLPIELPAEGNGIHTALVGDSQVQTLVVFQDSDAEGQPLIERIVEVTAGSFELHVSYQPGEARQDAVLISGYGSSWRFRVR